MYISSKRVLIKVNQKLSEIFGYESSEEMKGISIKELHLSKEKFEEFGEHYFNALKNGEKLDIEYQVKKKDNSIIWCQISGRTINKGDISKGVLWMVKDISLRKQYQLQLKNSEILNKNILSTIPDLVWLKDKDGVYLACNPVFEELYDAKEKDIIGKTDYDYVNKELADSFKLHDKNAIDSESTLVNEEWLTFKKTGKKALIETSKRAMRDQEGNIIGVLGMGHDITKRKEREEELKELNIKAEQLANSQQILLSLFDRGDTVLFNWKNDENWTLEYVSLSAKKLFGYEREEFISGKIRYVSCIHEEDLETVLNEVSDAMEKKLDYFKHKPYRIITKNAEERWILDNTVTIKNKNGEITNFIGYLLDITEQTKNQELIYHQSKIASIGEMLGNISHQWRQPLSAISTLATGSKLKKELDMLSDSEFDENMDLINNNAQYLSKTIDDFRNFFTSNVNIRKKTNLKETFNTIYSLIKDSYRSSNINIIFDIPNTNLVINENIFVQAILNILNNARDALNMNKEIEDKYVFVNLDKNEDNYLLIIKDNANGIPEKIKDKIFEPYFTTKHKSQGTGIGLYMTNQIITKQLQGKIIVKNVEYTYKNKLFHGACFEINIPI